MLAKEKIPMMRFKVLVWVFFILAVGLRLLLYWVNPPGNYFDDHYSPIFWIIKYGTIPPKDVLWQSYQPPVFYVISAVVGKLAMNLGIAHRLIPKILQFMPCLYGILTIGIVYLILKKVPLSEFSRLLAFGVICFLPRHIYMSAIHSNDTIAVLFVALCVYLMLVALDRKFSYPAISILSICITIALFTKYTSFVVIPMALSIFFPVLSHRIRIHRKKFIISFLLIVIVPLLSLSIYFYTNIKKYNDPLPWNDTMISPSQTQPQTKSEIKFTDFKPWESIKTPVLAPWNIDSFWTLIFSRMWFDMEPKFLYFTDRNMFWWKNYNDWLRGEKKFPPIQLSSLTRLTGSTLITLGLIPLLCAIIGAYRSIFTKIGNHKVATGIQIFPLLFLFNTAGIIALTIKSPVYSSMKASYFLGSIPAISVFVGFGVMLCEKHRVGRWFMGLSYGVLFFLVTLHIIHIAYSLGFKPGVA